jgi:Cd2+/Zn2+-exporting ATPase
MCEACDGPGMQAALAAASAAARPTRKTRFRIDGMDCASCASKIDTAVRRLAGIREANVSVSAGTLQVTHDENVDVATIRERVLALGYGVEEIGARNDGNADTAATSSPVAQQRAHAHDHVHDAGHKHAHDHSHDDHAAKPQSKSAIRSTPGSAHPHAHFDDREADGLPWWRTRKALLTWACGGALVIAYALGHSFPALAPFLFVAALAVGLVPIARRAFVAARFGSPFSIEMLMTIAAVGAVIIGAAEEAGAVVFLFLVGEMLEGVAAGRARASIKALTALVPKTAWIERGDDGRVEEIAAEALQVKDVILVRPGDRIPADGVVLSGAGGVDEAPVTGESVPKRKDVGDGVFAGTINLDAALRVRVSAAAQDNTIARVVRLVEEAQESKAPTERFIDRFSKYYTPAVLVVGFLVAVVPPLFFGADWYAWVYKGLALLLIGCPCALVISTPAAIAAGLATGARRGLLMKGGAVLEQMGRVTLVAFDKTGTLTASKPVVTDVLAFAAAEPDVVAFAAALEAGSSHPLARAILDRAAAMGVAATPATDIRSLDGKGMAGRIGGRDVRLVSVSAAREITSLDAGTTATIDGLNDEGKTVSLLVVDGRLTGLIAMRDEPREDAKAAIDRLSGLGVRAVMLTGDNRRTAEAIARGLGVEPRAELLPQDKQRIVRELQASGAVVAKVGDGINDAPALAAAHVGVAMGGGTDVALETADAASLHARVADIPRMIGLSRLTMTNIWQNIALSLGLKAVFLVTTVLGITGLWPAILADTGATVLVTANAMRLLAAKLP